MNRRALIRIAGFAAASQVVGCAIVGTHHYDAVVATTVSRQFSAPTYPSVQAALDAAPANAIRPFRILITQGSWREKLTIDKPFIHLVGEHRSRSVVRYDAYAGQIAPDGQPWGTSRTATITVRASDFAASNLTIENSFDYLSYLSKSHGEPTGPNRSQAVALMLDGDSDRASLNGCNIIGNQDTLFANAGRSLFRHCTISGAVDFVFGSGCAAFEECVILSRYRPTTERQGYVAAPSTLIAQDCGLVFSQCRLTKENRVPSNSVALGRAWRPTMTFADGRYGNPSAVGMAAYISCWMDDHISVEGWDAMEYSARDGSRILLQPKDARLFEYGSRGPGAHVSSQRRPLSAQAARRFDRAHLFGDWRPLDML